MVSEDTHSARLDGFDDAMLAFEKMHTNWMLEGKFEMIERPYHRFIFIFRIIFLRMS